MRRTPQFVSALTLVAAVCLAGSALSAPEPDTKDAAADFAARRTALVAKAPSLAAEELAREHFALGTWARDRHLETEARAEFQAVLATSPDHEPAHTALGDVKLGDRWMSYEDAMRAKGLVLRDGSWILREEADILDLPATERALRRTEQAKVTKLLVAYGAPQPLTRKLALETLGTVDDRYKLEPMAYALRSPSSDVRLLAAKELGRLDNRRALKPLVRTALRDKSEAVRTSAVASAIAIGDANLAAPFVKALGSEDADSRVNAAVALAAISDARSVRYLVWRMEAYGGGGARVYSFFGNQVSYIQDFDVEVAQTAFIADPVVGTIQEGIVLDAQVVGTQQITTWVEREVVHSALSRITGASSVKNEQGAWAAWWRDNGEAWEKAALAAK